MKILRQTLFALLSVLMLSCGGDSAEDKILHKAADVHMEALKIKSEMESGLEQMRQAHNSIQVQGRALTSEEMVFTKEVSSLEARLKYWNDNHIEVPGFEHGEHDHSGHDHNHDHSHGNNFQLPASDMLIIQKEFKDSIKAIQGRLDVVLSKMPK